MKKTIAQLKEWFSRGKYPTGAQFADWMDSYIHKDDKIELSQVENLTKLLNGKFSDTRGEAVESAVESLRSEFGEHAEISDYDIEQLKSIARSHGNSLAELASVVKISDAAVIDGLVWEGVYKLQTEEPATEEIVVVTTKKTSSLGTIDFYDVAQYRFESNGLKYRKGRHQAYTETADGEAAPDMTTWEKWEYVNWLEKKIKKEVVTVKCRCVTEARIASGSRVHVKMFNVKGVPLIDEHEEIIKADSNGEVRFEVPYGYKYSVYSELKGFSASFEFVYTASTPAREIELWNLNIGIGWLTMIDAYNYPDTTLRTSTFPYILPYFPDIMEQEEIETLIGNVLDTYNQEIYTGNYLFVAPIIANEKTCFIIPYDNVKSGAFCPSAPIDERIPTMEGLYLRDDESNGQYLSRHEKYMNGYLNTVKFIDYLQDAEAAKKSTQVSHSNDTLSYLPTIGQAMLLASNINKLNELIQEASNNGEPSWDNSIMDERGDMTGNSQYWWTSTPYGTDANTMGTIRFYKGSFEPTGTSVWDSYRSYVRAIGSYKIESYTSWL